MRRLILALGILPLLALGAPRQNSAFLLLTQPAPTANPRLTVLPQGPTSDTAGRCSAVPGAMRITGCTGYRITVCAEAGQTLAGAGDLDVYYYSDYFPTSFTPSPWPQNLGLTETVNAGIATACAGAACQCQVFDDHPTVGLNGGWIYAAPNGVTVSGGTTVLVLIEAACVT